MIKELADWIEDNSSFVCGSTLQVGHRTTDAPDRCILIQETGGGEVNFYQPDMEWVLVQIITRGETYFNARDDADTVHGLLHGAAGITIGTAPATQYIIGAITAVNPPQYIGQDETRRYEFSTNYRLALYNKTGY